MKKFKVRYDPYKHSTGFKKKFEKFLESDKWKDDAANLAIKKIQGETRLGNQLSTGESQPALSQKWIWRRQELAEHNPVGTSYGFNKSNLTLTGQLIKSLKRVSSRFSVEIAPDGARTPYKNVKGGTAKKTPTNQELANYLAEKGRKFLGFNEKLKSQIVKKLKEHIRRSLL